MSAAVLVALCVAGCTALLLAGPGHRLHRAAAPAVRSGPVRRLRTRLSRNTAGEAAEWAALLRRLAALLQAGRSPSAAFEGAAGGGTGTSTGRHIGRLCASVAAASRLGLGTPAALATVPPARLGHRGLERRAASATAELLLCWEVSERTGAPLTGLLNGLADALEAELDADAARSTALAGPRSTARILTWLPVLGIGLGTLMGVDPLGVLLTTPWGQAALAAGTVLAVAGRAWTRTLVLRAEAVGTP